MERDNLWMKSLAWASALCVLVSLHGCSGGSNESSGAGGTAGDRGAGGAGGSSSEATLPPLTEDQLFDQDGTLEVEIRRTTNGVPHIKADTVEELSFGQGYAQAEDNACLIADQVIKARSERALYYGPGPNDINIITDFSYKALDVFSKAEDEFEDLSPLSQAVVRGFAAGYNEYLEGTGVEQITDPRCSGQPWVRPILPEEVYAYHRIVAMFASGDPLSSGVLFRASPPGVDPMPTVAKAVTPKQAKRMLARLKRNMRTLIPGALEREESVSVATAGRSAPSSPRAVAGPCWRIPISRTPGTAASGRATRSCLES